MEGIITDKDRWILLLKRDAISGKKPQQTCHTEPPEVVSYYNSTKGGVDTMDFMAHNVSSKRQTRRWPMVNFLNILDVGSIAAFVVYSRKYPTEKFSNRQPPGVPVEQLHVPQIERSRKTPRLPKTAHLCH